MRKVLAGVVIVLVSFFVMSVPVILAQDACEGNFDYDQDVDGTDAFVFKEDFGRSMLKNPCPPNAAGPVPRTGQTLCYNTTGDPRSCTSTGEDGEYQKGLAWTNPRFTDNGDGTVTDNFTGLMWTQNAQQIPGTMTWQAALNACENLEYATYDDWRLPNLRELTSMVDYARFFPALPAGHPFTNIGFPSFYWSSSTVAGDLFNAWTIYFFYGSVDRSNKSTDGYFLWPVRGGQ